MGLLTPPTVEERVALRTLQAGAASVSKSMLDFEKWLIAGYSAIFVLALPKYAELSALISPAHLKLSLALLAAAIALSLPALFMSAQLSASAGVNDELGKSLPDMVKGMDRPLDLDALYEAQSRGFWWPGTWGARWGRNRMLEGDWVAPGRLVAKLSQIVVYVVMGQVVLGIGALGVCVAGLF
jgi:hypothetical protein